MITYDWSKRGDLESALRNAVLACRPDASISMVSGKHNLVLTVMVPQPDVKTDGIEEIVNHRQPATSGYVTTNLENVGGPEDQVSISEPEPGGILEAQLQAYDFTKNEVISAPLTGHTPWATLADYVNETPEKRARVDAKKIAVLNELLVDAHSMIRSLEQDYGNACAELRSLRETP